MVHEFISKLQGIIRERKLFQTDDDLLIAVSGGLDSMCLLHAIQQFHKGRIEVAHVNYKLRGKESDKDEEFIRTYCEQHDLTFHKKEVDLSEDKSGIQEKARKVRYEWFHDLIENNQLSYLLTAHHFDDQMETILLRLIRGTGLKGMTGILYRTDNIVRPMINIPKTLIKEYQEDMGVPYRQDKSNFTNDYTRNFIRNEVLRSLKNYYEDLPFGFERSISNFKNDWSLLQSLLKNWADDHIKYSKGYYYIPLAILRPIKEKETFLFHLLEGHLEMEFIHQLLHSDQSGLKFEKEAFSILMDRENIIIRPYDPTPLNILIPGPGTFSFPGGRLSIRKVEKVEFSEDPTIETTQIRPSDFPLSIRNWKEGDKFCPIGMDGNNKSLSDYFTDEKFNLFQKEEVPILLSASGEIIWIMGHRLDERFKLVNDRSPGETYRLTFKQIADQSVPERFQYLS